VRRTPVPRPATARECNEGRCRHRPPHVPALTAVAGWRGHLSLGGFGIASRREAPAALPGYRSKAKASFGPPGSREAPEGPSPIPVGSRTAGQARPPLPSGIRRGQGPAGSRVRLEAEASQVALRSGGSAETSPLSPEPPRACAFEDPVRVRRSGPKAVLPHPPPPPGGDSPGFAGCPGFAPRKKIGPGGWSLGKSRLSIRFR
jgi:hypothetical protein